MTSDVYCAVGSVNRNVGIPLETYPAQLKSFSFELTYVLDPRFS